MLSTGVIACRCLDRILGVNGCVQALSVSHENAARAIMTGRRAQGNGGGFAQRRARAARAMAKGSGMIAPNMACMTP